MSRSGEGSGVGRETRGISHFANVDGVSIFNHSLVGASWFVFEVIKPIMNKTII